MPDIAMCANTTCKSKETCYRYRAIPDEYQTMALFDPGRKKKCDYYYKIQPHDRIRPLEEAKERSEVFLEDRKRYLEEDNA